MPFAAKVKALGQEFSTPVLRRQPLQPKGACKKMSGFEAFAATRSLGAAQAGKLRASEP
jgi:hypothetical protein